MHVGAVDAHACLQDATDTADDDGAPRCQEAPLPKTGADLCLGNSLLSIVHGMCNDGLPR